MCIYKLIIIIINIDINNVACDLKLYVYREKKRSFYNCGGDYHSLEVKDASLSLKKTLHDKYGGRMGGKSRKKRF